MSQWIKIDEDEQKARSILGSQAIVGSTCHESLVLAKKAEQDGASYVAFGRFFPSTTKPNAQPVPPSLLIDAKKNLSIPVVAIGGITQDNATQLIQQGADAIAVVNALFASNDIKKAATEFQALF